MISDTTKKEMESYSYPPFPFDEAVRSATNISHFPETFAKNDEKEYLTFIETIINTLSPFFSHSEIQQVIDRYAPQYMTLYQNLLTARSKLASPLIVGPAKFSTAKMKRQEEIYEKRKNELDEYVKRTLKTLKRMVQTKSVELKGGEIEVTKSEIEILKNELERMKKANAIIRRKNITEDEKVKQLKEMGYTEEKINELLTPDYLNRQGFKDFELASIRNKIKRLENKLKALKEKEKHKGEVETVSETSQYRIVKDYNKDRVLIYFTEIPEKNIRDKLKSKGFHWSPHWKAWARKLTDAAIYDAKTILEKTRETQLPPTEKEATLTEKLLTKFFKEKRLI